MNPPRISVIVPAYNEADSLPILCRKLRLVLETLVTEYEVIIINDGSTDKSNQVLAELATDWPQFKCIRFRRNYGQTAAMMAGIDYANGEVIVPIDADLQNDPDDIPNLLEKLDEGFDVVSGWRRDRKDAKLRRNLFSRVANRLISRISGVHLHDYGCTLKAYRRDVVEGIRLYGEMHRFIPIYAAWQGARVTEIPVKHHRRLHGNSKYGLERILKVLLDIIVVVFLDRYFIKPIYLFGGFGVFSFFISFLSGSYMGYLKIFEDKALINTPLPLLTVIMGMIGVLSILLGLIAEILVRTYFESQDRRAYLVRELINFDMAK